MGFLEQIRLHKVRAIKTLALVSAFIPYGIAAGIIGPALLDLGLLTDSTIDKVSYIFPARCAGSIFGSIIGKENPPFFQIQQFAFGLGAFVAPLIVRPFILDLGEVSEYEGHHHPTLIGSSNETLRTKVEKTVNGSTPQMAIPFEHDDLNVEFAFYIAAGCMFVPAIYYFILWKLHPASNPHPSRIVAGIVDEHNKTVTVGEDDEFINQETNQLPGKRSGSVISNAHLKEIGRIRESQQYLIWKYVAIGLMCAFMLVYYGLELTYGQYLTSFSVKSDLRLSKITGTEITSVYWAMFTFVRLSTALYIGYLGSENNVFMNILFVLVANGFLIPFGYRYEWCLWIGSILMGMGCSSIWGSAFGYLEDYFPLTSKIGSLISVSLSTGEFIFPLIISNYIKIYPNVFLMVTMFCSISMAVIFPFIVLVCKSKLRIKITDYNNIKIVEKRNERSQL